MHRLFYLVLVCVSTAFASLGPFTALPPPTDEEIAAGRKREVELGAFIDFSSVSAVVSAEQAKHPKVQAQDGSKTEEFDFCSKSLGRSWSLRDPRLDDFISGDFSFRFTASDHSLAEIDTWLADEVRYVIVVTIRDRKAALLRSGIDRSEDEKED